MPAVSVIVPVYNAEKAIRKCIESVLNQDYDDFELILVDDGSKDNSPAILDEYAAKDERIKVVHKPNSGVSATRNLALSMAQGTYIRFMDADDWMADDSLRIMVREMEEKPCDLIAAGFYRVVGDRVAFKSSIDDDRVLTLQQYAEYMMDNPADYYFGVLWNKLYRRDLIEKWNVRMDESLSFCEDFIFNLEYLLHVRTVRALNVPVYYYVKTEGSLVAQNLNPAKIVEMKLSVFTYYSRFFKNILDEKEYRAQRISIARFLVSAANDEMVIPMMPGTRKLGEETVKASFEGNSVSPLLSSYYERKLFERYLNTIAIANDLSIRDAWVYAALCFGGPSQSAHSISDFTGIPLLNVMASLEKLTLKGDIDMKYTEGQMTPLLRPVNAAMRKDMEQAAEDLVSAMTKGFSAEEKEEFLRNSARAVDNMKAIMKGNQPESE